MPRRTNAHCPICNGRYAKPSNFTSMQRKSRDHILPQERGGSDTIHGGTRNIRIMCQQCNCNIAASLHCIGAMACVQAVARDTGLLFKTIARRFHFGITTTVELKEPPASRLSGQRTGYAARAYNTLHETAWLDIITQEGKEQANA